MQLLYLTRVKIAILKELYLIFSPTLLPVLQHICKLYPSVTPSILSISPAKYKPGQILDSSV